MFKWVKIIKNQYLGLWLIGLVLFAVQELPYMIMPLIPLQTNPIMDMPTNSVFLDVCEKIAGILCVAVMVLIVHGDNKLFSVKTKSEITFFSVAAGVIALNFVGWILYFCGTQTVAVMIIFIFALPPLYYLFIGLWRKNYFLVGTAGLFFIIHLSNAFVNLL
ncbi:MAG: hypothetical protein K2K13_03045 [Clostridiales bacterium]|nr:hypothetical protein [Clostridiales bacterium]